MDFYYSDTPYFSTVGTADSSRGGTITVGNAANTKGSQIILANPIPFDVGGLYVHLQDSPVTSREYLVDIMLDRNDGQGARVIIPNILYGRTSSQYQSSPLFPVKIPRGGILTARAQGTSANETFRCLVSLIADGWSYIDAFDIVFDYGITSSGGTGGTSITPGVASMGSWTQLTANVEEHIKAILVTVTDMNFSGDYNNDTVWLEIGAGPSGQEEIKLGPLFFTRVGSNGIPNPPNFGPFPVDIRKASRLVARGRISASAAGNVFKVGVHCFA